MDSETREKIGRLTRRDFSDNEIYTFPGTLCDNEIDRDAECFSDSALEQLARLFIGKPVIVDHNATAENQVARIYDTAVITDGTRTTKYGAPYRYIRGMAYMVRTADNAGTITRIDGGILKEMSVACSAGQKICSVCGQNLFDAPCGHQKGETYDGKTCYHILDGITDAYELSFVAVPAQPGAGVTKHYSTPKGETAMDFKPISTQEEFDNAVQPLIDAAVSEARKQFEGYLSPEEHRKALGEQEAAGKAKLLDAYRTKAAALAGLPEELAARLTGETEEEIGRDAQQLAELTRKAYETPHFHAGEGTADGVEKAFYAKNPELK